MTIWGLLALTTVLYAGYNLLVKLSGSAAAGAQSAGAATTTIAATICLQIAALSASLVFVAVLAARGGHQFTLPAPAYLWAVLAGLCIGGAEIAYFYIFSGFGGRAALPASTVIPTVVAGTIVITVIVSVMLFGERLVWQQWAGALLVVAGLGLLFTK